MKENLVEIQTLLDLLGFSDIRSARKFCTENKIPLLNLGKRVYTHALFLDLYVEKKITAFVDENYTNPSEILAAVKSEDKDQLLKAMETLSGDDEVKVKLKVNKSEMSQASKKLLDQLKSA